MKETWSSLAEPFLPDELEWRIQQCGKTKEGKIWAKCVAYIQARAIMDRLDKVVGPDNWKVEYRKVEFTLGVKDSPEFTGGIICSLFLNINGNWISKEDGAEQTDIESFKGGLSSALKRAAVLWGMGRYLYSLDEAWAEISNNNTNGARYAQTKDKDNFYWIPPKLPDWALPKKNVDDQIPKKPVASPPSPNVSNGGAAGNFKSPTLSQPPNNNPKNYAPGAEEFITEKQLGLLNFKSKDKDINEVKGVIKKYTGQELFGKIPKNTFNFVLDAVEQLQGGIPF